MLTVELLREYGADTDRALERCLNNEEFYLRLVRKAADSPDFDLLEEALSAKDLDAAFEHAHKLKGMLTNLSLTPLSSPVVELTETLRGRADTDYGPYLDRIAEERERLAALLGER